MKSELVRAEFVFSWVAGWRLWGTFTCWYTRLYPPLQHRLGGSADSDVSYVILPLKEKMADTVGFSVRWAQRPLRTSP
jgi:hypothetical protein